MFNVIVHNCQILTNDKVNSLVVDFLTNKNTTFLCLTETWCTVESVEFVHFPNFYKASSFCRIMGRGGGNGIWCKSDTDCTDMCLDSFCVENVFEVCGVTYRVNKTMKVLIVCYRPPGFGSFNEFCDHLYNLLNYIFKPNLDITIVGDFNVDPSRDKKFYKDMLNIMSSFNLFNNVNEPTRNQYQLDHVFCNYKVIIKTKKMEYSDHKTIVCKLNLDERAHKQVVFKRDFSEANIRQFCEEMEQESWGNTYIDVDFQIAFNNFHDTFSFYFYKHFPLKKFYVQEGKNWVTNEVKASSNSLKSLYQMQKYNPSLIDYYKNEKAKHSILVRHTKRQYYQNKVNKSENMTKCVWGIVHELNNREQSTSKHGDIELNINGKIVKNSKVVSQHFNNFFVEAPRKVIENIPITNRITEDPYYNEHSFFLNKLTEDEIINIINQKLKSKYSTGFDNIPSFLIKRCLSVIVAPLTYLVNKSFECGAFPEKLKVNKVVPIHKKGEKRNASNYRPVTLTSPLSKIFEYCFLYNFESFLTKYKIISENQFGFRANMSTMNAVDLIISKIVSHMENGECPAGVFCDLSRAFDCVDHDLLLQRFFKIGVRGNPLKWSESFLKNRKQYVCMEGVNSEYVTVDLGVPQGTVLGPIFFIVYLDSVNNNIKNCVDGCTLSKFADDSGFVTSDCNTKCLERKCNNILANLSNWFSNNSLFLNIDKTSYVRFHHPQNRSDLNMDIKVNGGNVKTADSVNFLGIVIDKNLNWKDQCSKIVSILHKGCYLFRNLRQVLSTPQLISVYYGKVESILRYGLCFWGTSTEAREVFIAQKRVIRCMVGVSQTHSCKGLFKSLNLFTLYDLMIYEMSVYFYRNKEKYNSHFEVHQRNTRNQNNYVIPFRNSSIGMKLPNTLSVRVFMRLPADIKSAQTISVFKNRLRRFLIGKVFYSIDEYFE